ncbi:MAG: hypothetical protein HY906_12080 [Deltaproteobacteria bacterium]|nr:hypothetical protein [Deltaproteobacteria bacterium]
MRHRRLLASLLACAVGSAVAGYGFSSLAAKDAPGRDSRLFRIDTAKKKILGPASHVPNYLGLRLVSVSMDQPQYWRNEKVRVKVMMPGRPGTKITVAWNKRDGTPRTSGPHELDAHGVAVVEIMDGGKQRLELGEYRVEVRVDKSVQGSSTFAVVEGSLGAVSLAYEFKRCTSLDELEKVKAGWFLGNVGGAGKRWGNGLSFKNELRVANQQYNGKVELASRCMLPGCNGIDAGPRQTVEVKDGKVSATMDIRGHSGPFQVEFITPKGSLRHQFEGSSHVERDMVQISKGVRWLHRAGLAPYQGTVQVPGRQVFVDKKLETEETAFEIDSVIATGGQLTIKVRKAVTGAALHVWVPMNDGKFERQTIPVAAKLKVGDEVKVPVAQPFSLVAVGGYAGGKLSEGYVVAFPPAAMKVAVDAPRAGAPLSTVPVTVTVTDVDGRGLAASGILEAFDNRVASKSPASPLASAVGDSFRNVSNSLSRWVDPIALEEQRKKEEREYKRQERRQKARDAKEERAARMPARTKASYGYGGLGLSGTGKGGGGYAMGRAYGAAAPSLMAKSIRVGGIIGRASGGDGGDDEAAEGELIREGEQKVVFCERVAVDAGGRATVQVKLPPQTGRLAFRFVALKGLDHATGQAGADVSKRAYVEVRLPNAFVPGAQLEGRLLVVNTGREPITLSLAGPGVRGFAPAPIAPGAREIAFPWKATGDGKVVAVLSDARGKVIDRREHAVRDATTQAVTFTRIEFGGKKPVGMAPDETAMVFEGPGRLLKGVVMNMVTTMYSWFGHAEALSAQVAVRAAVLAAIHRGILDDDGLEQTLRVDLDKAVRDLHERFYDEKSGLVRPYPGLAPNPLWSAWAARNLHSARRAIRQTPTLAPKARDALRLAEKMTAGIDKALKAKAQDKAYQLAGYDPNHDGLETVPVEIDGKVVWRVITDDAVQRFVVDRLTPMIDPDQKDAELAFGRAYDTFRFLRAFKRTGAFQYLMESAKAAWLAGPKGREEFNRLYATIARGMIVTQEPGLLQGPALLGGVYSTPMAMVRFFELVLLTGGSKTPAGAVSLVDQAGARAFKFGEKIKARGAGALRVPAGAVVRLDRPGRVSLVEAGAVPFARAAVSRPSIRVAQETVLHVQLDQARDPLEYYAVIAVPTTTSVKQTEDILSDYKGQLVYGQQGTGGAKLQFLAVPFRGARDLRLWLEGLYPGTADAVIAIRHMSNPADVCTVRVKDVNVQ